MADEQTTINGEPVDQVWGLQRLKPIIGPAIITDAWIADTSKIATDVTIYRNYVDGDHDFRWLSEEQRVAMNIVKGQELSLNYCENILHTFSDRLEITGIEAPDNDAASEWLAGVLDYNSFERLQTTLFESVPTDGQSYFLIAFDNEAQMPVITHELQFDGSEGIAVVYRQGGSDDLICALKFWNEIIDGKTLRYRVNVFYEDRVEKWGSTNSSAYTYTWDDADLPLVRKTDGREYIPWVDRAGNALGVPVIVFKQDARGRGGSGKSILTNAIPIQNATNRSFHSLIAAEALAAFQVRYIVGMPAPAKVAPGMWIEIYAKDENGKPKAPNADTAEWMKAIQIGAIDQGDLAPHIETLKFQRQSMYEVTGTPDYNSLGPDVSGESRKEYENRLLSRIHRAQIFMGDAFEIMADMLQRVYETYRTGNPAPIADTWLINWAEAQQRNDNEIIDNAIKLFSYLPYEEFIRMIAVSRGWDEEKIGKIVQARTDEQANRLTSIISQGGNVPGFGTANQFSQNNNGNGQRVAT